MTDVGIIYEHETLVRGQYSFLSNYNNIYFSEEEFVGESEMGGGGG